MTIAAPSAPSEAARSVLVGWTGAALAASLAAWALMSDPSAPDGAEAAATVLLGWACWVAGGQLAGARPEMPGLIVSGLAAILVLLSLPESLGSAPSAGPLGYANANGALVSIGLAGFLLSVPHLPPHLRPVGLVAGVACLLAEVAIGSAAALVTCLLLLLVVPSLHLGRRVAWQATSALALLLALVVVVLAGRRSLPDEIVASSVGSTRQDLWSDALATAAGHPVRGVGPGRFAEYSEAGHGDPDLAWAHSEPLQLAAELGWVGFAIAACLVAWMVLALGRSSALLAVLALQPMIDYTLHFPLVVALSCTVLGASRHVGGLAVIRTPDGVR